MNFLTKKGQGSLEYLLILAAVLAIAVVVVVIAQNMISPGRERGDIGPTDELPVTIADFEASIRRSSKPVEEF